VEKPDAIIPVTADRAAIESRLSASLMKARAADNAMAITLGDKQRQRGKNERATAVGMR